MSRPRERMSGPRLAEIRRYVARCPHDIAMRELLAELDATVQDAVRGARSAAEEARADMRKQCVEIAEQYIAGIPCDGEVVACGIRERIKAVK